MTISEVPPIATPEDGFLHSTRDFDAPRDTVWRFWTEPESMARWFGPQGIHVDPASVRVDAEAGGVWALDMVDDDSGERYPINATLDAIVPPEYFKGIEPNEGNPLSFEIWLEEVEDGAKTRMTLHQGPFTPEFLEMTDTGWASSFDKLDAILAENA